MLDHGCHKLAGQRGRRLVAFRVGQMPLEDRVRGALAEVGLEDRGQRESTSRPSSALAISLRPHRR
ncbi:MAG TPA: hypothetical protein VFI69_02130 [Candidatus Limnocylindrales bacterium]|nr:hypothetical protein [Candidatus Limnocylindrales bacterium]